MILDRPAEMQNSAFSGPNKQTITLFSPAKLNLFLHILGRRPSGYHELQTVFQLLDYGDDITFQCNSTGKCQLTTPVADIDPDDNLITRAAKLLQADTGVSLGADIQLTKRLPIGGGLGGGSSNAATTLIGLNHLWQTHLSTDRLADLGLQLGADVPVFIRGFSAWAEGVGERLDPIELPEQWYLVVKPPCSVSTAEIFSHEELTRDTAAITVAAFFERGGRNDCEQVVSQCYPDVNKTLRWLGQFGKAQLTGTGACVFIAFSDRSQAEAVLGKTPTEWESFIAKGINYSPLQPFLCK